MAGTVQVLVVLSTEEQLEGEGETPRRPGREGSGRGVGEEDREGKRTERADTLWSLY